jgi:cytochrome c oxidase assembly protein subunit 15
MTNSNLQSPNPKSPASQHHPPQSRLTNNVSSSTIRNFRRFAVFTTAATYFLIFIGGLVRVSGAGLGCPDWPKCFGTWIPPTDVSQIPAKYDASLFNPVLMWIEYANRLVGVVIGFLILTTAVLAVKNFRHVPKILWPSLAAFVLVIFEAWQGSKVVSSELRPVVVSVHLLLALVVACLLIYATLQAYLLEHPNSAASAHYPESFSRWVSLLWLAGLVQMVLGTQVRSTVEAVREIFPLASEAVWLSHLGIINYVHALTGIVIATLTVFVAVQLLGRNAHPSSVVREAAWAMVILVAVQLFVGYVLMFLGLPAVMQVFHLWTGSLYVGVLFVLVAMLRYDASPSEPSHESSIEPSMEITK